MSALVTAKFDLQEEFVEKIKCNDEQALRLLYVSSYASVERYVLNNSGTQTDVKDIFQESYLALWRNVQLDKFDVSNGGSLKSYLLRIAKNKWLDVLRQRKRLDVTLIPDLCNMNETQVEFDHEKEKKLELIKDGLKNMGSKCKELLCKFYYKKESLKEIAQHFSWNENTAKNNKYRCLQKLRSLILNQNNEA